MNENIHDLFFTSYLNFDVWKNKKYINELSKYDFWREFGHIHLRTQRRSGKTTTLMQIAFDLTDHGFCQPKEILFLFRSNRNANLFKNDFNTFMSNKQKSTKDFNFYTCFLGHKGKTLDFKFILCDEVDQSDLVVFMKDVYTVNSRPDEDFFPFTFSLST